MPSLHRIALLALPLLGMVASEEPASPTQQSDSTPFYANANEAFQDLLNALPEESLHVALHSLTKFKDGVFESHRHGVERVHQDNPPLATKLIVAAVQDLKKRQQPAPSNGTTTPTQSPQSSPQSSQTPSESTPAPEPESSSSSPPTPQSSQESAVVVPVPISTTDSNGQPTVISSEILSEPTASVAVPVTRTNEDGQTFVSQETKPAVIFTATDSAGSAFVTTSAVEFQPTAGQVLTRTNAQGSTFLTTYTPPAGRVSSILLITTTGADGAPSVITSYTFVEPARATNTGGSNDGEPTGTPTGAPGLQTGAAAKAHPFLVGGVAAVGGALALFV
ncbi:hypothetical protein BS50DRAFT_494988 [Corynespora cassiicola Philippines]|uniref:Uncharacterized protein n=1 Tax=Corynespora cassiicola Philippines TaxID=1448308 RepID=A0A2T2NNA9_CORCC|nr:hypothetical protein BS50DRAFT_494988 [Corynespora cassiicola Philippines]